MELPPGPVEPDKSSLWMDLFSLASVILIVVTCNRVPFSWPRNWLVHGRENSSQQSAKSLKFSPPHQLVVFLVKDPSMLCVV